MPKDIILNQNHFGEPMRSLFILITILFCSNTFASQIIHNVLPGRFHTGGTIKIKIIEERQENFDIEINYEIKPKRFVPISTEHSKGTFTATLPIDFLDERGYENLANGGPIINQGATIEHMGFEDLGNFNQAHHVKLTPESRKWLLEAWFHSEVESTGWAQLAIELQNVPLVGKYKIYSELNN